MFYEINVSKSGAHYFATAERSLKDFEKASLVFEIMKIYFPKSHGFEVTMTKYETIGYPVMPGLIVRDGILLK